MPYTIRKENGKFVVYKKEPDGKIGKSFGTHDTQAQAQEQIRAIEANESKALNNKSYDETMPAYKFRQDEVGYTVKATGNEICANCRFFKGYNYCHVVCGSPLPIVSGGYCNQWFSLLDALDIEIDDIELDMSFEKTGFKSIGNNRWVGWFSNNFEDLEGEIFSAKSIADYVSNVKQGFLPLPELWYYHIKGTKFGVADSVFQVGHFVVATGKFDDTPIANHMKSWIKSNPQSIRMSHGFFYNPDKKINGVYHDFATFEITVLDKGLEANPFTPFNILGEIEMKITDSQKQALYEKLPKAIADEIIAGANNAGEKLRDAQIAFKSNDEGEKSDDTTPLTNDVMFATLGAMFQRLENIEQQITAQDEPVQDEPVQDDSDKTNAYILAIDDSINDMKAQIDRLSQSLLELTRRKPRASKSDETVIDDNDAHANFVHEQNYKQGKQKPVGLIEQIKTGGNITLSNHYPQDDDLPPPPVTG